MSRFTEPLVRDHGARAIMGKGGLLPEALEPLREHGGVYLAIVGGAAALQTTQIDEIEQVEWEDLMPECLWRFRVCDFGPLIVAMDSHGEASTRTSRRRPAAASTSRCRRRSSHGRVPRLPSVQESRATAAGRTSSTRASRCPR